jgi:hypothetical protein
MVKNGGKMKKRDYVVRVLSLAPILAAVFIIFLYVTQRQMFGSVWTFASMLITLGILPLLAYPFQLVIPKLKAGGRKAQRTLAMIFAVVGYVLCLSLLLILGGTNREFFICLTYLVSGILILIINKVFKVHASGHGCGVCGPVIVLLILKCYIMAALYAVSAIFVCISSVRSKRHTLPEFLGGASVSMISAIVLATFLLWI